MSIAPVLPPSVANIAPVAMPGSPQKAGDAFSTILSNAMGAVESLRQKSEQSIGKLLSGEGGELHEVALDAQKAELSFEMFLQVRNKVVQAYQQVMQMQL